MMKNNDSCLKQGFAWNEFEVIARKCTHAVRLKNTTLKYEVPDFHVQAGQNVSVSVLDTDQILYYPYIEDDLARMDEFRVKRNNERFGFSVENPSDAVFQPHASH
jgi:hypothetical protein